jgi:hypothetical protein
MQSVFLAFVVITVFLSGCAPASTPVPLTPTSVPTDTPVPTNTPAPTNTPVPTKTPIPPTATVPAPEKSSEHLNGVQVVLIDTFDNPAGTGWGFDAGKIKNGSLEVLGKNWNGLNRERDFTDNQGVIVDFTYAKGSVFEMLMDSGEWSTDPYKRFGVYVENTAPKINVWVKQNFLGGSYMSGNLKLKPDTT